MIRVLNLLITVLHTVSDVRRRVTLPATAALLTVAATLVIARTVTADTGPARSAAPQRAHAVTTPVPHTAMAALPPALQPAANDHHTTATAAPLHDDVSPRTADTLPEPAAAAGVEEPAAPVPADTPASPDKPDSAPATIVLAAPQFICVQGVRQASIASAVLTLAGPAGSDMPITWYWEVRVDSGTPASAPVSPRQVTQTVAAGQTVLQIAGVDAAAPLLTAPQAENYAYSVRLHATVPFDVASDWAPIPQAAGTCAP